MLIQTTQTGGGPIVIQTEQVVYLRQISPTTTGVVLGAKGFSEFALSVDTPIQDLVGQVSGVTFVQGQQTNGGPVAINGRHIRYARQENDATVFVLGARGGEEFAVSVDMTLDEAVKTLESQATANAPEVDRGGYEDMPSPEPFGEI